MKNKWLDIGQMKFFPLWWFNPVFSVSVVDSRFFKNRHFLISGIGDDSLEWFNDTLEGHFYDSCLCGL